MAVWPPPVLGADGAGLELELLDRLGWRRHLVVAAALQVAAERHAFDQDLVRVVAAAVDRSLERVAHGARQTGEDELLDLALPIGHRHRPGLVLLVGDIAADLGGAGLDHRRRHGQLLGDRVDVELEIERQRLRRAQRDVVGRGRSKASGGDVDAVAAVGEIGDDVDAGVGRGRLRLDVGLEIGRDHGRADEHAAGGVGHRPVELRPRDLRRRDAGDDEAQGDGDPGAIQRAIPHLTLLERSSNVVPSGAGIARTSEDVKLKFHSTD